MECAKPQAATELVSQACKNVSRKTRKPPKLKAFSFQNYQYNGQCMFSTAGHMLNSTRSSMATYILIYDNYDVVC